MLKFADKCLFYFRHFIGLIGTEILCSDAIHDASRGNKNTY